MMMAPPPISANKDAAQTSGAAVLVEIRNCEVSGSGATGGGVICSDM
jgi:hypothetical protein